ncbi:hypothetical protein FACS1894208_02610 [Clostridia bacterium]|nr:hypothetical protein FACS1894208_02610 [Clostridia bacterium]
MSYQIQNKSDLSSGATLVVRIPESEVDKKALYTVVADMPSFILPFHFKNVDGDIEFTYSVGARNKLQYSYGSRNPKEYTALWSSVLNPLLTCNDWFMNPFSFVLQTDYLYYDKNSGAISYVYIPSVRECSDTDTLKQMASELAEKCPSNNSELEIKSLRAIMQGFNPKEFLQMLKADQTPKNSPAKPVPEVSGVALSSIDQPQKVTASSVQADFKPTANAKQPRQESAPVNPQPASGAADDIVINLHGGKEDKKKASGKDKDKPKSGGLFGGKPDKKPSEDKPVKQSKPKGGGLFGKKEAEPQPIIMGAAAEQHQAPANKYNEVQSIVQVAYPRTDVTDEVTQFEDGGVTQLEGVSVKFRFVGNTSLPSEIIVNGNLGRPFIIGRFDISVGRKQSDFEFDRSTKAVSRRHAAIEQTANGYAIIDLSSSAGTFVNGQKLTPNVPHELTFGTRVSFGTSGADYVFEG